VSDFYISYNYNDQEWAEWVAWQLKKNGYMVNLHAWDVGLEEDYIQKANKNIDEADRFIALLSPYYLNSPTAKSELERAYKKYSTKFERKLLPVRVRECHLEEPLKSIVYIDLVGLDEGTARAVLLYGVKDERYKPDTAPSFPEINQHSKDENPVFPGKDAYNNIKSVDDTLNAAMQIPDEDAPARAKALADLMPYLPENLRGGILDNALHDLWYIWDSGTEYPEERINILINLAPYIPEPRRSKELNRALNDDWVNLITSDIAREQFRNKIKSLLDSANNVPEGSINKLNSLNDLRRLIEDKNSLDRLPDKEDIWNTLLKLTGDNDKNVKSEAAKLLGTTFRYIIDKDQAWNDLHQLAETNDNQVRHGIAQALGRAFPDILDKDQAWSDLHRLAVDNYDLVRRASAWAIGTVFPQIPDKEQAWGDLHHLANDGNSGVRWATARALGDAFPYIPDKEQAWRDLIRLTNDNYEEVRQTAAESLGSAYTHIPDKKQAWDELHHLTEDKDDGIRCGIAMSFGIAYPHILEEKQAWNDLHRLSKDNAVSVRIWAAKSIGTAFSYISDRQQACNDLLRLKEDDDNRVRWRASEALRLAYPYIPEEEQAKINLERLAGDNDKNLSPAADALDSVGDQIGSPSTIGTQMRARSDLRSSDDLLGFEDYANAFADLIESPYTDAPLTIGIYGSWGMGKSSLLGQIDGKLKERHKERQLRDITTADQPIPKVHVINFNAWEYSATEVVWPGLVRKIIEQMEPKNLSKYDPRYLLSKFMHNRNQRSRKIFGKIVFATIFVFIISLIALIWSNYSTADFWNVLQSGAKDGSQDSQRGLWAFIILLSTSGLLGIILVILQIMDYLRPLSQWTTKLFEECDYGKQIGFMEEIREDLKFLESRLDTKKDRILVVIDDLDRCEPNKTVEVLQAINLLLNFKSFIVCLGIDARIVTRAVEMHYKNLLGPSGASGYEYLEKIVQIPFRIPEPNQNEVTRFIAESLGNPKPKEEVQKIETIAYEEAGVQVDRKNETVGRITERQEMDNAILPEEKKTKLPFDEEDQSSIHIPFTYLELDAFKSLAGFLRPNPRHMKRLINVYSFARTLARYKRQRIILDNPKIMVFWLVICGQWPYTMHAMLRHLDKISNEEIDSVPDKNPLIYLLEEAKKKPQFSIDTQAKLDYDLDKFDQLLHENETLLGWSQLRELRQYTINFNPAIEAELKFEVETNVEEDESRSTEPACNS
jgi:HEAT repeat protein/Cdc6-like AAA superfamily ATPase